MISRGLGHTGPTMPIEDPEYTCVGVVRDTDHRTVRILRGERDFIRNQYFVLRVSARTNCFSAAQDPAIILPPFLSASLAWTQLHRPGHDLACSQTACRSLACPKNCPYLHSNCNRSTETIKIELIFRLPAWSRPKLSLFECKAGRSASDSAMKKRTQLQVQA